MSTPCGFNISELSIRELVVSASTRGLLGLGTLMLTNVHNFHGDVRIENCNKVNGLNLEES